MGAGAWSNGAGGLVERARTGDRGAQQALFEVWQMPVYNYLKQMTRDPDAAADLTQETFVRALGNLRRLRHDGAFRSWLFQIAHNLVKDRAAAPLVELDEDPPETADPAAGPETSLERDELKSAVDRAVAGLSAEHREVVLLHHLRGLEVDEIAHSLRLPAGTVKSRLARARGILRRRLAPYVEG